MNQVFILLALFVTLSSTLDLDNELQMTDNNFESNKPVSADQIRKIEKRAVSPSSCLSKLYVMAFTSNLNWASSDSSHRIELRYNRGVKTMDLYNRPGDDYLSNKGDLWELSLSGCIRLPEIQSVSIVANGNDGWNIGSIVTLVSDPVNIQLLTRDFDINRWIDGDGASSHRRFDLTLSRSQVNADSCLSRLYVMAFTSGVSGASSDSSHGIQIQYNGAVKTMALYDRPGDDYMSNKGDLWELGLSSCIKFRDIQRVSIVASGNDGWNIESIVTLVSDSSNIQVLTRNFDVNRWIDGDGAASHGQFDLTLPGFCLSKLYVMAFTSNLKWAGSDTSHRIELRYNGGVKIMDLYNRPGDDYMPNKGDLWELSLSGCIRVPELQSVSIVENGNDGWNIESIVTLVSDSTKKIRVLTQNFGVNKWIDGDGATSHTRFALSLSLSEVNNGSCLSKLYVMAFTSGVSGANSDSSHSVQLQYNGVMKTMDLYDRPGDDYLSNKGDLWELSLSGCIKFPEIQGVSVVENGNDGWNIGSIVTLVSDSTNIQVLTQDFDMNCWIDGDGSTSHKQLDLTLPGATVTPIKCNGMEGLCNLRIDQVTFPGAHNAGAGFNGKLNYASGFPAFPQCVYRNVYKNFYTMLNHGIRFFDIDTCLLGDKVQSCHKDAYGGPLSKAFDQIDNYMKCHKNEVIILHFNRDAIGDRATIAKRLVVELEKRWNPNKANNKLKMSTGTFSRWPTLRQAIETNQRIFIFMDNNLAQYVSKSYIYNRNDFMRSTWEDQIIVTNVPGIGCDGIIDPARRKCDDYGDQSIIELAAYGSTYIGLGSLGLDFNFCVSDMAKLCSLSLKKAADECYKQRAKPEHDKTVNVLLVDYPVSKYYPKQSVVDIAKILNERNIKRFSG